MHCYASSLPIDLGSGRTGSSVMQISTEVPQALRDIGGDVGRGAGL